MNVARVNERVGLLLKGRHELLLNGEYKKRCVTESVESVDVMTLSESCGVAYEYAGRAVELR